MSKDGDFLYGVKSKSKRGILRRLWAIVALSALFSLFLFMAFIFAFRNTIFPQGKLGDAINLVLTILAFSLVIFFCYVIIIILYKYISPVNQRLSELFLGGLCSLFVIVLGTIGLSIYLRYFSTYNAVYGSLTAIVVFLLWAYIVMLGLVFGVIVNDLVYQQKVNAINLESKVKENKKLTKSLKTVPKNKRNKETGIVNG
jgi:membrane protein